MFWRRRTHGDPLRIWLRAVIREIAAIVRLADHWLVKLVGGQDCAAATLVSNSGTSPCLRWDDPVLAALGLENFFELSPEGEMLVEPPRAAISIFRESWPKIIWRLRPKHGPVVEVGHTSEFGAFRRHARAVD
jgi:hypothetical protein